MFVLHCGWGSLGWQLVVTLETAEDGPLTGWILGFNALTKKRGTVKTKSGQFTAGGSRWKLAVYLFCSLFHSSRDHRALAQPAAVSPLHLHVKRSLALLVSWGLEAGWWDLLNQVQECTIQKLYNGECRRSYRTLWKQDLVETCAAFQGAVWHLEKCAHSPGLANSSTRRSVPLSCLSIQNEAGASSWLA